jgi:hypothetical protein
VEEDTGMVKSMFRLKVHALFPFLLQAAYILLGIRMLTLFRFGPRLAPAPL